MVRIRHKIHVFEETVSEELVILLTARKSWKSPELEFFLHPIIDLYLQFGGF